MIAITNSGSWKLVVESRLFFSSCGCMIMILKTSSRCTVRPITRLQTRALWHYRSWLWHLLSKSFLCVIAYVTKRASLPCCRYADWLYCWVYCSDCGIYCSHNSQNVIIPTILKGAKGGHDHILASFQVSLTSLVSLSNCNAASNLPRV